VGIVRNRAYPHPGHAELIGPFRPLRQSQPSQVPEVGKPTDDGYRAVMSDVVAPGRGRDSANSTKERIHLGLLAQENQPVPGGSIFVYHPAHELVAPREGRYEAVCSLRHPDLPEGTQEGVRCTLAGSGQDLRTRAAYDRFTWRAQAERLSGYYDDLVGIRPCQS
jgi:hypothetical protein